jgi:hypothetical protein
MFRQFVQPARLTGLAIPAALFLALVCLPSDVSSAARRGGGHGGGHHGGARQIANVQAVVLQQQMLQARLNQIQILQAQAKMRAGKHHSGAAHAHKGGGKNFTNIRIVNTPTGTLTQTRSKTTTPVAGARHHGKKSGKLVVKQNTVTVDNGLLGAATTTNTLTKLKGKHGKHGGKLNVTQTTVDPGILGTGLATVTALKTGKHGKHGKHGKLAVNNGIIPAPIIFADPVDIVAPVVPDVVAGDPVLINPLFAQALDDLLVLAPAGVVDDEIDAVTALRGR